MLPVIGSKSYTDDMSSSLSITSPSIISIARARGGSGLIREAHSLAPTERVESPVTPDTRSETRRPPVRPGEAATSQVLELERREGALNEWTPAKAEAHLVNCPYSIRLHTSEGFLSGSECKSDLGFGACWECPVFSTMVELAFYPAVALMYFFGVLQASKDDRVELDDRASMNVFCLFVLAQPLCLVLGGYTGMATYLITALVSYNFLPWKTTKQAAKGKESKKKK
eukprot:superscaffoldBa00001385_g10326